ncbi:hypothetical protein [Providencia rettgeri]|uniref:hypothetical protein n=1 Tax=Providencia rettgeri TaxID=587 RepID=UPI001374412E|nr:hypothetical protein [Providencia rettgeri]BBV03966.1 hypothetical protein BML2531_17420 [Providencia rettgeri]
MQYININGYHVDAPVQEPLKLGDIYFLVSLGVVDAMMWDDDDADKRWLQQGRIHLTKEAAEAHFKALLSFTQQ